PKPEEIALAFKSDFEALLQQNVAVLPDKRAELVALHQRVQRSKAATEEARLQKLVFLRMSFLLDLLHFYDNQSTEAPDAIFAQRLPGLIEQFVPGGPQNGLDEKLLTQAEGLLSFVISPEHRQMIINNIGKGAVSGRTLKFVLRFRTEKLPGPEMERELTEFVKHLVPSQKAPPAEELSPLLRLIRPEVQRLVVRSI